MKKPLILLFIAFFLFSCASISEKKEQVAMWKEYRHIAVVDVVVEISVAKNKTHKAVSVATGVLKKLGLYDNTSEEEAKKYEKEAAEAMRQYAVNSINRRLLQKGFYPVQRNKIEAIADEYAVQQSGLTESASEIGKMVKADAVCTGKIIFFRDDRGSFILQAIKDLVPAFRGSYEVSFAGEITAVESGIILHSEAVREEGDDFETEILDSILKKWFKAVPSLR